MFKIDLLDAGSHIQSWVKIDLLDVSSHTQSGFKIDLLDVGSHILFAVIIYLPIL